VDEEEMLLRIAALLRRSRIVNDHRLTIGDTVLDYDELSVTTPEKTRVLPKKELLTSNVPPRAFTACPHHVYAGVKTPDRSLCSVSLYAA